MKDSGASSAVPALPVGRRMAGLVAAALFSTFVAAHAAAQSAEGAPAPTAAPASTDAPAAADAPAPTSTLKRLERGIASWYGSKFHGRRTSNGERFDMNELTAAHPTLPFGTLVRVRNLLNGREVVVRINDRLPPWRHRIIDLSKGAAAALGFVKAGKAPVVLTAE